MEILDISLTIKKDMIYYSGDPTFTLKLVMDMSKGDDLNLSEINMGLHTGTHIDCPLHFIKNGKSITDVPITQFYGKSIVIDVTHRDFGNEITNRDLESYDLESNLIVLFKTRNSSIIREEFREDFVSLSIQAADSLIRSGVKAVGIDYLSIGDARVHKILLSNKIIIYEGLTLQHIVPGWYTFIGFPLKLMGSEGSPTRAVLVKDQYLR